jgi:hypothetical protein
MVPKKNLFTLLDAYAAYRDMVGIARGGWSWWAAGRWNRICAAGWQSWGLRT